MFLTCADIDRRHPSARQALGDCCDMHRNVMRLFAPEDNMRAGACVLFRVLEEGRVARLYLTSATPPDLSRAAWLFCGRDARQRDLSPLLERFRTGLAFGFDLLAYPCKKVDVGRTNSVRAFLTTAEERRAWLVRQGEKNGFALRAPARGRTGGHARQAQNGPCTDPRRALFRRFGDHGRGAVPRRLSPRRRPGKGVRTWNADAAKGVTRLPKDLNQLPKLRDRH